MNLTESKYWNTTILLMLAVVTIIFCFPLISSWHNIGEYDWDYHFYIHEVPRKTIVEYGQFPLWNPYSAGGYSAIGNSQTSYLSPSIIYSLIFGTVIGVKVEIFIHIFSGLLGMYLLARQLKLGKLASFVPAFVFILNSYFVLHIAGGHTNFLSLLYLPFIFLFYLKSLDRDKRYFILTSVFIALTVLEGGAIHFALILVFFGLHSVLSSLKRKSAEPFIMMLVSVFFGVLYCAPKLLPSLEVATSMPRLTDMEDPLSIKLLYDIFLNPSQSLHSQAFLNLPYAWWEYGAYIGPLVLFAFMSSFIFNFKDLKTAGQGSRPAGEAGCNSNPAEAGKSAGAVLLRSVFNRLQDPFFICGALFLLIGMGDFSPLSPWHLLHKLPIFKYMHVISRVFIFFVFMVALMSGMAFDYFEKKYFSKKILIGAGILLVLFNLLYVNSGTFKGAFTLENNFVKEENPFVQTEFRGLSPYQMSEIDVNEFKKEYKNQYKLINEVLVKNGINLDNYAAITPEQITAVFNELIQMLNFFELIDKNKGLSDVAPGEPDRKTLIFNKQKMFEIYPRVLKKSPFNYYGSFSTLFPALLKNMGVINGYENINVAVYTVPSNSPKYRGEYYLYYGNGNVNMTYWSPNRMIYKPALKNKDILVINQNYEKNWKTKPYLKVRSHEGLLAVDVGPGNEKIEFYYMPESFKTGIYLLIFGLILSFLLFKDPLKILDKITDIR